MANTKKKTIKALTLRKLPERVEDAVRDMAEQEHLSFSKAVVRLLEKKTEPMAGFTKKKTIHHDLDSFFGTWTKAQGDEFMKSLWAMRKVDREMEP